MNKFKALAITITGVATLAAGSLLINNDASAENLVRVAGSDRYETAANISRQTYSSKASSAVIVSGETFADALSATPLASAANGPVLLIKKGVIPQTTWNEIQRILPAPQFNQYKLYVLGGEAVINKAQTDFLTAQGYDVVRLAGRDRMHTSVLAAMTADSLRGTKPGYAYIVNGFGFADGLAVGPLASIEKRNVLVTESGDLSQSVRDYVNGNIDTLAGVALIGGTSVIPQSISDLFTSNGFGVTRIAGSNRYGTATKIAESIITGAPTGGKGIGLASGRNFPDALAAGPLLAFTKNALILDQPEGCKETLKYLQSAQNVIAGGFVFGGKNAVSSAAESVAEQVIGGAKPCK